MDYISQIVDVIEYQQTDMVKPLAIKVDDHFIRIVKIIQMIPGLTSLSHDFGYCYDIRLEDGSTMRLFLRTSDHVWFIEVPLN